MHKIGDKSQGHHEAKEPVIAIFGVIVSTNAGKEATKHKRKNGDHTRNPRFGARTNVFAVTVASIAKVGRYDGFVPAILKWCVFKLVGSRPPS